MMNIDLNRCFLENFYMGAYSRDDEILAELDRSNSVGTKVKI